MVLADEEPLSLGASPHTGAGAGAAGGGVRGGASTSSAADGAAATAAGGLSKSSGGSVGGNRAKAPKPPLLARPIGYKLLWVDEQRVRAGTGWCGVGEMNSMLLYVACLWRILLNCYLFTVTVIGYI
jgi:hypothetical protein